MICTRVVPCLSSGLAKNNKIMSMFVQHSRLFCRFFKVWLFFENGETNLTPKQSSRMFWSIFKRYNNKITIFQKSAAILTIK